MPDPVVVTRPLAQAYDFADRIKAIGREAVIFPLLEISPLADDSALRATLSGLDRYAMVAFVSPNAIDAVFRIVQAWPRQVTLAVVGEGSRRALVSHGITDANATIVRPHNVSRTDSQTLLEALDLVALRGKEVLVVRGETGRELLADTLREAGVQVTQIAAYRRTAPVFDGAQRRQLNNLLTAGAEWVLTSSEALRNLVDLTQKVAGQTGMDALRRQHLIVPHIRIEETARLLDFRHVTLTGSGDEQVLAALQCKT